jgi:tetratricopeptide (TPR) repeat protein
MGFGKKTDPSTGKTLDLDQTYKNIIRPSVISAGYECVRADEIQESGIIDKSMYALLIQAELVIADISTYNPNAIYELGVRHAVKPFSTIILKEKEGKIPFDLDHTRIFQYSHAGEDIGTDEAKRCQNELENLIRAISGSQKIDSPLYEFIKDINPPKLHPDEYALIVKDLAEREKHIFAIVETAKKYMEDGDLLAAATTWGKASKMVSSEHYFVQQRALCIYKSKHPSPNTALVDALAIIRTLEPDGDTTDPETLGITGAIYKNLWLLESDIEYINRAIHYYGKCFKIRNDYYTGENYAHCLNLKEVIESDPEEKTYLRVEARKTRKSIISRLENESQLEDFMSRPDKKWVYASLSQCYFGMGDMNSAEKYQQLFFQSQPIGWEIDTFKNTREQLEKFK